MSLKFKFGVVLGIILFISGNNLVSSQWQEHPINCYNCEGSNCTSQLGSLSICTGDAQQSCVTVFSEDKSSVIARGCSQKIDITHASHCAKNTDKCISCDSNGCNIAKNFNEYVTCVSCDSRTDKNCVINPNSITNTKVCHKSCMVALRARNATDRNPSYELFRSCLDDKDLDDREICASGKDRLCKACESDKCNLDNLPDNRLKCNKCNGDCEDPIVEICIDYNDAEQCYFKFDGERDIVRMGCRSELKEEEVIAQVQSRNILLCDGSECNSFDKLPADSHCKVCDSDSDRNCATNAAKIEKSAACNMPYPQCYSMVKDGRTIRGCIAELSDEKFYQCFTNSTKECVTCSGKNCNEQMFAVEPGARGLWQDLPINCYTCNGEHCAASNGLIRKCEDNNLQTCITVFSDTDKVIARGCSDEIKQGYETYCEKNPSDCLVCMSNGCNIAYSKADYIDCIFCDAISNDNCTFDIQNVKSTRKCHKSCMTALYPRKFDTDFAYNLVRGCLDDKDLDDRESCGSDNFCKSCSDSPLCNTQLIPEEKRHTCQYCSEESCQKPVSRRCPSYTRHEQCYIKFKDTMTASDMGCKSDFDLPEINSLLLAKKLFLCDGDDCNKLDNLPAEHSCRICNSRTDVFCATEPRNIASLTKCSQLPITSCYTRLLSDGHIERGCLSSLNDDDFFTCYNNNTTKCSICDDDDLCNDNIFPSNRLACHICNSADDKACEAKPIHSAICHPFSNVVTCVTSFKNGITYRGCSSQLSCDVTDISTCHYCNTSNCNAANLKRLSDANPGVWQNLPLNCYTCTGSECHQESRTLTRLNMCTGNDNQYCMTVFDDNGKISRRGCSDDVEKEFSQYCDEFSDKCFNCNSNGCNNASSLNEYIDCIYCDSKLDKNCVQSLTAIESTSSRRCNTACMVALLPRSVNESSIYELSRSCLDDKDLDDRESCGTDGSLCRSCTTNNCNEFDVIEDRLQCYSCLDGNCDSDSSLSKKCAAYTKNDKCFILFEENGSIHRTGCTSEFNAKDLEDNFDKMIMCTGKNCNDKSVIPTPQMCYTCDSIDDNDCASLPNDATSVSECNILPNVDCYIKIETDGTTKRGCVSDLSRIERQACLHGHDKLCLTCVGNKCNGKVFPEDRLSCHKCNSLEDPDCQDKPNSPTICSVYSDDEVCSTKLVDGVTYRGCGSDFTCDDSDKQYCKMCNSSNCNVANLYKNNIGYPGNWQDLPINCYTCNDAECETSATTKLRKCENNNLQNCVTVFNMAGKVVQRGCSDAIYDGSNDHHCDQHPDLCTYCKSSGCNNAQKLEEYTDCLFCDSTTSSDCTANVANVRKTRKCRNGCMTALYPKSEETNPSYELLRSCLDDKDPDDSSACANGNDPLCKACQGPNCNKDDLPDKRLSCNRCVDSDDCEDPVEAICPSYKENDRCFILFDNDNNIGQMGCASDFDSLTLNLLRKKMLLCDTDNCNTFDLIPMPHKCWKCNSEEDPRCATNPDSLTNNTACNSLPYTSCYSRIEDGHTIRGCLADLELEQFDKCLGSGDGVMCKTCDSEGCNNGLYPENRQICYRCSSNDDEYCHSDPAETSACPLYKEDDQCVATIFGDTTNRACASEISCNTNDREICRVCPSNKCNSVDLITNYIGQPGQWQDLPLNCYTCSGNECQTSSGIPRMCENNNLQKCETVFDSVTKLVVRRGCSDDVASTHGDYCDQNKGLCQQCKSSGCNKVAKLEEYVDCVFCDTTTNSNCVLNPSEDGIKSRKCNQHCMVALYPRSSEEDPAYELSRSCMDDMDIDDIQDCIDSKNPHCQACSEGRCNVQEFPLDRHECWSCRGEENCEDAISQKCIGYRSKDQCYILFDDSSSITAMGCGSDYEKQTINELVQSKQLLLCDEKNCNSYESIPAAQSCIVCHSATDPRCATNPNLIVDAATCSNLPYTGCYTLINEDGDTVRGCQSSLESSAFYACHTQTDKNCNTCTGNNCNTNVFPSNRTTCHRCNSRDDGDRCATSPSSTGVCPKYTADESCVTSYNNGITYRDCLSELSCDPSDKKTCRICTGSACNTVNLEHVANDGEPGKWQDLPLKCQTCKDATCNQSPVAVETCANNNLQNCVTVFDADGKVIQRGCSDSVEKDQEAYCEQNTDKCFRCNSNECNIATQLTDYVQCVSCDTNSDSSCVTAPGSERTRRNCHKACMTALYPKSSEDDPAYDTIRTCLDDKEPSDQQSCQNGNGKLCKSCTGKECNIDNIPNDRRKCWRCSGDDCQKPRSELCPSYRENDECSLLLDDQNSIIEAGCKSDYTIAQTVALIKAKRLILCAGKDECNTFDLVPSSQRCSVCNSRTDPNCATNPSSVQSSTTCNKLPYTQCYSRVLTDGATERGCLSNLLDNDFYDCLIGNATTCESCVGDNCNKQIYPENRKSCHICDSDSDDNCHSSPNKQSICPKYAENDACVTSFIAGATHRGCQSSINCDPSDRKKCRICPNDNCNIVNLERKQDDNYGKWQDLPLECHDCTGDACSGPLNSVKKCENNNEQDCSIVYDSEGNVIRRGCSDDVELDQEDYCEANPDLCFNCKSNRCNGEINPTEFNECVYCDSNKNISCVTEPESSLKTRICTSKCMTALYPSDSSSNPTYDLVRTCLNDKEKDDQANCVEPLCSSCSGNNCNIDDIPDDRLNCHSCLNDSCENPVSQLCPLYKKDDKCFVRYDSSSSIVEMGCLSSFRSQDIASILSTKRVYICEGENCNKQEKLPQAQKCLACNSLDDVNCAINAPQVGIVKSCNALPYPNCHTSIESDGSTHRGCLTDLPADSFVSCLLSGGDNCTHCLGDLCNREHFPPSRLQCYSCNSEVDSACEDIPEKLLACPLVIDSEKCVTSLVGNTTIRGCSSQITCDSTDKSTCRQCSSTGCNTVNLANRNSDTNYGMWQELPLKCYNCTKDECAKSLGPSVICANGDQQDCMTVYDEQGTVVRRGCAFDVEDEKDLYCRQNPDKCVNCKSNECNDGWNLNELETCAYCNSATDSSCVTRPTASTFATRKCQKGCMAATYTAPNGTTQVIRTCLDDKEVLDRHQCTALNSDSNCLSCIGDNCNLFNYPTDRLSCHRCTDEGCPDAEYCAAYEKDDKCYTKYNNGKVEQSGCETEEDNTVLQEWREANQLFECSGSDCNAQEKLPTVKKCVTCDSRTNVECATNPALVNTTETCSLPINSCMTRLSDQATLRSCLDTLTYSEQQACGTTASLCEQCVGDSCNSKIYPTGRRSCYICQSDKHDHCVKEPKALSVCPNYSSSNQCVTKFDGKVTERGCTTDLTCDVSDPKHCKICDADGCNTVQLDGAMSIIANNLLLTIVVAIVGLRTVKSHCI